MNSNDWSKLSDLAQHVAEKIGQLAPHVWEIAQRQVYGDVAVALIWAAAGLLAMGASIVAFVHLRRYARNSKFDSWDDPNFTRQVWMWFTWFALLLALVMLGGAFMDNLTFAVRRLINPDYYTLLKLREILFGG